MLEARVSRLESDVSDIKDILRRLEPLISEMARNGATRDDILRVEQRLAQTREEMVEMRGNLGGRMEGLLQTKTFIMWMIGLFLALAALVFRLGA
jgi:hypothetical protein